MTVRIKTRVEARMKSGDTLKHDKIDVAVENGVVTLTGTVGSRVQRTRARRLARVDGVTRVENKLEIDSDDRTDARQGRSQDREGHGQGRRGEERRRENQGRDGQGR